MRNGAMKALIIDDEPAIREALAQTLRSARIETVLAEDGEIGLTALEVQHPVEIGGELPDRLVAMRVPEQLEKELL